MQGHSPKAITRASGLDTFNATMIYANSGAAALSKVPSIGKPIVITDETPVVIYHRATKLIGKGSSKAGSGGDKVSSGPVRSYFSEVRVTEGSYVSGLRADRPIEIRVAMAEAVKAGLIFIKIASEGILPRDVVSAQCILSVEDTERKVNLYRRHQETSEGQWSWQWCSIAGGAD